MGELLYGDRHALGFDDRTLNHLRTVITTKLLRQESFAFTYTHECRQRTYWMHPAISLVFEFDSESTDNLNPAWVAALMQEANSPSGLRLVREPD